MSLKCSWLASLTVMGALALTSSPAVAQEEDDDTSTDSLGDQKGSDRVSASESKVDRSNANFFEKERFFIDKIDTPDTEEKTLFQGNIISSTFFYNESGSTLKTADAAGGTASNSQFSRLFTDLRLQLDARHIKGGRWLGRVDVRGRAALDPEESTKIAYQSDSNTRIQSGLTGESELEAKELWLARPGDRADVFIGRQTIPDLGAVKIDGIRIDYAKSDRVTVLGFAGAYPLRGSRSIETDYPVLRRSGKELGRTPPIAAGLGAAYRTQLSYGSLGGGAIAPLKGEKPRIFVTSTGYLRTSPKLDLYHFGLIDLVSEGGFAINNLSAGLNYRPTPALRATASVNHVDTETLEVQARTFLEPTDASFVRNDTAVRRISSTQVQGGLSAGLGRNQQVEVSVAVSGRYRPDVTVNYNGIGGTTPMSYTFTESKTADVLAQLVHRNLLSSRIGIDLIRSFSLGDTSARSDYLTLRAFLSREFRQGRGSWDGEVAYSNSSDDTAADNAMAQVYFGKSKTSTISAAGTVYYRLKTSWFLMGSVGLGRFSLETISRTAGTPAPVKVTDPGVTSISMFARLAYRF